VSDAVVPVAVIGLGVMGAALAARLLAQGWPVHVCDRIATRAQALAALGATPHAAPADAARAAVLAILAVADAAQTRDVLFGAGQVAEAMALGHSVMLCPTLAPEEAEQIAQQLRPFGLHCIEAPLPYDPVQARAGSMRLLLACAPTLFERHRRLFETMSSQVLRIGETPGDAARARAACILASPVGSVGATQAQAPPGSIPARGAPGPTGS